MQKNLTTGIAVAAGIAVVALFFIYSVAPSFSAFSTAPAADQSLVVQDEVVGAGTEAQPGDFVTVQYTGKLENGTVFDTSVGQAPIRFQLGTGYVIPGWEQGLVGMKQGGKRLLIIPPQLGYGPDDYGPIPGNSTLIFEIELVKVEKPQ